MMKRNMTRLTRQPIASSYQPSAISDRQSGFRFQVFRHRRISPRLAGFRFCRCGFTLVELLAVITIITMLAALVVGGASFALRKASVARCYANMEIIKNALSDYQIDKGIYPPASTQEADGVDSMLYEALVKEPESAGRKPYLIGADFVQNWPSRSQNSDPMKLVDPWGNYYRYRSPGVKNRTSYDLWSCGPDGEDFTKGGSGAHDYALDDINNWSAGR